METNSICAADPAQIDTLLTQGLNAYQRGDHSKALKKFEKCLRLGGDDIAIREAAAQTAMQTGAWPAAARHWLVVHQSNPARPGPVAQYVTALINNADYDIAAAFCLTAPLLQKGKHTALRDGHLVRIALAQGHIPDAQARAAASYAARPDDANALQYARAFFEYSLYPACNHWISRLNAPAQDSDDVLMLQARMAYAQHLWADATRLFQRLAQGKQAQIARIFLARIAANTGDAALAATRYAAVLAHRPGQSEAVTFFIRTALRDYDTARALDLLDTHWQGLDPVGRINLKARALGLNGDDDGIALYLAGLARCPADLALRRSYAGFLLDFGHLDAAADQIATCLKDRPADLDSRKLQLRHLQISHASAPDQLAQAQAALALAPRDVTLLNNVGGLLARCNRRADAVAHYRDAVARVPQAPVLWRNGAYHTAMDNRLEEAADFAQEALTCLGTDNADQLANAAWILQAAGQQKAALGYIERAIALNPDALGALEMAVDLLMEAGDFARAWDHICRIDMLHAPRRTEKIAHAGARCRAAFRAVNADGTPVSTLFPETLFAAIVARSTPDHAPGRCGVVQFSSSLGSGGAERQVAYVMQGTSAAPDAHQPCTLAVNGLDPALAHDFFLPDIRQTGCRVTDMDVLRDTCAIRDVLARYPAHADNIRALAALPSEVSRVAIPFFAHLVATRPQVVHLWQDAINIAGGMAAMAAGVPQIVLCTRSTRPVEIRRHRRYLRDGYLALLGYTGDVRIVNNSANGARDYADWLGLGPDRIEVFYNGYDFEALRARATSADRGRIRAQFAIPADAPVIGGVMRFSGEKRPELWVQTLIAGVAQHADLHGLIVGAGPMRSALMAQVAALGLRDRIHFAGRQTPVEPWMRAMDILFLSSLTEGLPNVLIEAQALGVPVATMNVGGAPEALCADRSGIVLKDAAPDVLAAQILTLLADAPRMQMMRENAVDFVTGQFGLDAMIARLRSFYQPDNAAGGRRC